MMTKMKQGYKNINEPPCKISFYQHVKVFKRQKNLEYTMLQSLVSGHINWNGHRERKKKHTQGNVLGRFRSVGNSTFIMVYP